MQTLRKTTEGLGDDDNHLSVTPVNTSFSLPMIPSFAVDLNVFDNDGNKTNASSSSISSEESLFDDALLKDTMEQASKRMGAMQEELIKDEIKEITITEEAGDAEVIDLNTNVDHETIKKWQSLIVTDHYGIEHHKHLLVRSFSPHGLQLARDAHSTDRMKRVRGEMRYAPADPNGTNNSNSVIQAFTIFEMISECSFSVSGMDSMEDELLDSCNNEETIMLGKVVFLLKAKSLMSSSPRTTKLVTGHAELFGKNGKKASYTHMPFEDRNAWHITASVEETIETINCKGYPSVQLTSNKLACIKNIDAVACLVVQPKVEMFHSDNLDSNFLEPQYSRVFEINDLEQIFQTLQSNRTSVPPNQRPLFLRSGVTVKRSSL